jgi:hypothetical protein
MHRQAALLDLQHVCYKWEVAFSFVGKDDEPGRQLVERVAEVLRCCWGEERILYDRWHDYIYAKRNCMDVLPREYYGARLIAVFFSKRYAENENTMAEFEVIEEIAKRTPDRVIAITTDRTIPNQWRGERGLEGGVIDGTQDFVRLAHKISLSLRDLHRLEQQRQGSFDSLGARLARKLIGFPLFHR